MITVTSVAPLYDGMISYLTVNIPKSVCISRRGEEKATLVNSEKILFINPNEENIFSPFFFVLVFFPCRKFYAEQFEIVFHEIKLLFTLLF